MAILLKKSTPKMTPSIFFGRLFQARDILHTRHLRPTNPGQLGSGWEHKVLNDLYDELLDLTDGLIESWQGKYGIVEIIVPQSEYNSIVTFLEELAKFVEESYTIFPDSWVQNELDTIQKEIYAALYKLKNLK